MATRKRTGRATKNVTKKELVERVQKQKKLVKKISRRKKYKVPPQTNEPHPLTHPSHHRKIWVVAIVTLIAIIGIVALMFFSDTFVGRAFFTGGDDTAGVQGSNTLAVSETLDYHIKANIGDIKTTSFEITGTYPPTLLECAGMRDGPGWNPAQDVIRDFSCDGGDFSLKRATLNFPIFPTQEVTFAIIPFTGKGEGAAEIAFTKFAVLDVDTGDVISLNVENATIQVTPQVQQQQGRRGTTGGQVSIPKWSCGSWSYCNATLNQSRECIDLRGRRDAKIEVQGCAECIESWTCGTWSSCKAGKQTRTCTDDHACRSTALKPDEERSCTGVEQQTSRGTPRSAAPVTQRPAPAAESFFQKYLFWLVGGGASLLVIAALIIITLHHFHATKHVVYNYEELKQWIMKEKSMGTPDEHIKEILSDHTGWSEADVAEVYKELEPVAAAPAVQPATPTAEPSVPAEGSATPTEKAPGETDSFPTLDENQK